MNTTPNNYNSSANHNLSSVLSQIQDNGPAYADVMKQQAARASEPAHQQQQASVAAAPPPGRSTGQFSAIPAAIANKKLSPGIWLQLLLLLISAALLISTLFSLEAKNASIELSLSDYDEQIQETIDSQSEIEPARTSKINKKLSSLQKDLKHMQTEYSALNEKFVALSTDSAAPSATKDVALAATASEDEILALKKQLLAIKDELKAAYENNDNFVNAAAPQGLTVNLASLSNKSKAEKIVRQLSADGLYPFIEQAMVRGKRVYRLSVSGFSNRTEAESFIRRAGEQYGMHDSWIRKS